MNIPTSDRSETCPTRAELVELIARTVRDVTAATPNPAPPGLDEGTRLFGRNGLLDSLTLVSVVLDVEQEVNERYGLSLSMADERSVSQERSQFRTVASLADYVLKLAADGAN